MLSKDELKHLAKLARLRLDEEELEKFQKDISRIVEFVGELKSLKTAEVESGAEIGGLANVFRADEENNLIEEKGEALVKGFIAVPEVFKEE